MFLLPSLFLYFGFTYALGLNYFSVHLGFAFILLGLIGDICDSYIIKTIYSISILIRFFITSIMSPFNSLLSALILGVKNVVFTTFASSTYYKRIEKCYYNNGLFSLLIKLAIDIHSITVNYLRHNFYNLIVFQSICIYSAFSGNNLLLIISLFHLIIHLPFFMISILAHITVVDRNFYRKHPLLFAISICACFLLFVLFIFLVIKLFGIIYHLIDYYLKTKSNNGENTGGNNPGYDPDSRPGSTPPGGGNPGPSDPINSISEQDRINRSKDKKNERMRKYRSKKEVKDRINESSRKYRAENKDLINENRRNNPKSRAQKDKHNENNRKHRAKNKDSINENNRKCRAKKKDEKKRTENNVL